jgi:hypothetical protein
MKRVLLAAFLAVAPFAFGQVDISSISGIVKDPSSAAVPGATVDVISAATNSKNTVTTSDRGEFAVPALPPGAYHVNVTKVGFKAESVSVTLIVGVPASVNIDLQVGATTETIQVTAGATLVQAETADVSTNLTGRQLTDLPFATRNAIELLVDAPGTSTPTNPRSSTFNGLPKGAINVTIDGMNTQDNYLKSNDGYFSYIFPSIDALEEVTLETSAAGVDSTSQGGAQVKFVTKSGTNQFHGGVFWQGRNTYFNANYYFNNNQGLPRDILKLNQFGGHVGGPIIRNKLFFFVNAESLRLPGSQSFTRTYLTPSASNGIFTYVDTKGNTQNINLLALGSQAGYYSAADPVLAKTFAAANMLGAAGSVKNNTSSGDYNTLTTTYQPVGLSDNKYYTVRLDYNITSKHQLSFVWNYDDYSSIPDILNSDVPIYPGTGTTLFSSAIAGQTSHRFDGTITLRSVLKPNITNEFRAGLSGGTVLFGGAVSPGDFNTWHGYNPSFASPGTSLSGVTTYSGPSRRNSPVKNIADTVSWLKGSHQISFGFNWDQINLWQQSINSALIPSIAMGIASTDPIFLGSTSIFTTANLPNASSSQLSQAANLFADVTGRVNTITKSLVLSEANHMYGAAPLVDRDRQRELGFFGQDQWRVTPSLTATVGLRVEKQFAYVNVDNLYSAVSYASLYGTSGVGNLFTPGANSGVVPTYTAINGSPYSPSPLLAPSIGLAWQVPVIDNRLAKIFTGSHSGAAVLRAGYSIATVREGSEVYQSLYGSNQGLSIDDSVSASTYPTIFGAPGSVNLAGSIPSRTSTLPTSPSYPLTACFTCSLNGFNPNLKTGYVQSWNVSYQRELDRNTVVDFRYTGNHGTDLWRQYNINEVNIFQSGWLTQFQEAQNNLTIARGGNITNTTGVASNLVNNFGNSGLPGQVNVPLLTTALGTSSDSTTATYLMLGQAGTAANATATNQTRLNNLIAAGYPANLFQVNPTVAGGGAYVLDNSGSSYFNSLQIEVRRRMSHGITFQASYAFAKAEAVGGTSSQTDSGAPTTLRNFALDRVVEPFDIRNAFKFNFIYELPFGEGRGFGAGVHNPIAKKFMEGWQISGVSRIQSGTPLAFQGLGTFDSTTSNTGVILHNITASQFQSEVGVYKSNLLGANGPIVFYLPPPTSLASAGVTSANNTNIITNTLAAFNLGGFTPAQVDPNAPYISAAPAGQLGWHGYFYLPWQKHLDLSIQKNTRIREGINLQISAHFLDALNIANFIPTSSNNSTSFGQMSGTAGAYRDLSGTNDPGARIVEFVLRLNF